MIKPTVGRIVNFTPASSDSIAKQPAQPLAAIITCVWGDACVNLAVFDANGNSHSRTSVALVQDGGSRPSGYFCEWMPYQKGQAAKAEALEDALVVACAAVSCSSEQAIELEIMEKGLTAPRLTPADIDAVIVGESYHVFPGTTLTVCCLTLRNGYTVTGESAAASPENFDADLGRKIARNNARDKVWPLEGYLLRQRLSETAKPTDTHGDCPHAAPFRFCPECVANPCPIGLGKKSD